MRIQINRQFQLAFAALMVVAGSNFAEAGGVKRSGATKMQDAVSHDQLALALRQSRQQDPMKNLAARSGDSTIDPVKENRPKDLVKNSDILCFLGSATLVPKRAMLHVPDNYKNRLKIRTGAKIKSFPEFYAANRGWIQTVEVSRAQAEGSDKFSEAKVKMIGKNSKVVVATFKGGPISVLPVKETPENETQAK